MSAQNGNGRRADSFPAPAERAVLARVPEAELVQSDALLTPEQVAGRWQVPKAHVYRLAREGGLKSIRLGKYVRFDLAAVKEYEANGGSQ